MSEQPASIRDAFRAVARHPSFYLSIGNTALALSQRNYLGAAGLAAMTSVIGATIFRAAKQGRAPVMPFFMLGAMNLVSAGLGIHQGIGQYGLDLSNDNARATLLGNTALAGWGAGHLMSAYDAWTEKRRGYNMATYGVADVVSVAANPAIGFKAMFNALAKGQELLKSAATILPLAFGVAGTLRAFFGKAAKPDTLGWHATPARLLAAGYIANGIIACIGKHYGFGAANIAWGFGSLQWDQDQNKAVTNGLRRALKL